MDINLATGLVVSTWNGLERGDEVKVLGTRGRFTFHSVRLDKDGRAQWVTVVGGTSGHSAWRHFYPQQIKPIKKGRTRAK